MKGQGTSMPNRSQRAPAPQSMTGRILIVAAIALLPQLPVTAQTVEQFVKNASAANMSPYSVIFESEKRPGEWTRLEGGFIDIKYDVVKTDSVLNPIVAIVTFTSVISTTSPQTSKEAAAVAALQSSVLTNPAELRFHPTKTGWKYVGGRYYSKELRQWFDQSPTLFEGGDPQRHQRTPISRAVKAFEVN